EAGGTPVDAIPAAPTNLTANAVYASQIELAWVINSTNETGFSVQRKVGAGGTYALLVRLPPRTSSYIDTSILPSTTYFYQVPATGTAGDSPWSNEASATTTAQPAPTAPSNLAAATTQGLSLSLTWTNNLPDATGFRIERKGSTTSLFVEIGTTGAATTTFLDAATRPGVTYTYRVRASSGAGLTPFSNEASGSQPASVAPTN